MAQFFQKNHKKNKASMMEAFGHSEKDFSLLSIL